MHPSAVAFYAAREREARAQARRESLDDKRIEFQRATLLDLQDALRDSLRGSVLALAWQQNFRTSPVKRGVWVLENILGTPPPEPPPNVPPLEDTKGEGKVMTLREQMTMHRKNEPCASCHKLMDPIGFALENFDADGGYRTMQGGEGGVSGYSSNGQRSS